MTREIETRFIALMGELFQLDEAEQLDFGIYRLIRRHNQQMRKFLGVDENGQLLPCGGELGRLFDKAFHKVEDADIEDRKRQLARLGMDIGILAHTGQAEADAILAKVEATPKMQQDVATYRFLRTELLEAHTATDDRTEALNRLHEFYDRHYQDGDFIVHRRYGKGGARYVKSTGDDTEFHWATEDMYYIKSGDIFTDYPVRLANGKTLTFTVDPETLVKTRAELKPSDKAGYQLKAIQPDGSGWRVVLDYLKGAQNKGKLDKIAADAASQSAAPTDEIKGHLRRYIARNQSDFFIHKRLREALDEDLDIFIKTEVLDADQLLTAGDSNIPDRAIRLARAVREIGQRINAFLGVLEDHQKRLWEKKKLVLATRYVITLDRIETLAGKDFADYILPVILQNRAQVDEWQSLGLGTTPATVRRADGRLLPLPIDTRHFDEDFKWALLAEVTAKVGLDDALDGVAIHSDNWQALNVLQQKYDRKIQALYADPPYNTDAGPIDYKNGYRKGSWAALIYDRLVLSRNLLQLDGIACATIDDYQQRELHTIMEMIFGVDNRVGTVAIRANPRGRPTKTGLAVAHEYAIFFRNDPSSVLDKVERTAKQQERYKESDEQGVFEWMNFRRQGSDSDRSQRPRMYYPIFLGETSLRIPKMTWNEAHKEWELHEKPKHGEVAVYPIDEDGNQKRWRWKHDEVTANPDEFQVKDDRSDRRWVYFKYRPNQKGVQATTIWSDARHSATEYGTAIVKKLFGKSAFSYPKSFLAVQDCLKVSGLRDDEGWCIDIFAGSGTTAHAVMVMNADDGGKRKFILVETNKYFDSVTLNRVKKVGASFDWKDGCAEAVNGSGVFIRVQSLEQYDDTLENLATGAGESGSLFAGPEALAYDLDAEARQVLVAADHFTTPFGMSLRRIENAEAVAGPVDLVESLIYLLGLHVARLYREAGSVVITGRINGRNETATVLWRDNVLHGEAWLQGKMATHPADRYFTNAPETLAFAGIERFEGIENIFAEKMSEAR